MSTFSWHLFVGLINGNLQFLSLPVFRASAATNWCLNMTGWQETPITQHTTLWLRCITYTGRAWDDVTLSNNTPYISPGTMIDNCFQIGWSISVLWRDNRLPPYMRMGCYYHRESYLLCGLGSADLKHGYQNVYELPHESHLWPWSTHWKLTILCYHKSAPLSIWSLIIPYQSLDMCICIWQYPK
jgi:hypothetical protein